MSHPDFVHDHPQTLGEEVANSISHGLGLLGALVGVPLLLVTVIRGGSARSAVGAVVFALSLVMVYLASTIYHALKPNKAKHLFRIFDHSAIYLLIAGTYTPFTLGPLRGPWGWTLLVIVWTLAICGLTMKAMPTLRHSKWSMVLYIVMGWLVVVAAKPVLMTIPLSGILWIIAGGFAYTGGLVFFNSRSLRYSHFIWHLFVLTGSTCHYFAVLWYT